LVRYPIEAARGAGIGEVVVVTGHDSSAVTAAVDDARVVHNAQFEKGQASSLRTGFDALGDDIDGVVVLMADQPGITDEHVRALLTAAEHRDEPIVRLRFTDGPGPALLRREIWDEVRALDGDLGARALIDRRPDQVFEVVVQGVAPPDVDTPADLERLEERADGGGAADPGYEKPPSF
jgi:molybdenum cofactor cytidylyltransferase